LFQRLSDAYRQKFHIPFILCVRRHTKDSILRQYERRLRNTPEAELETALSEIFRIGALRLSDRVMPPTNCRFPAACRPMSWTTMMASRQRASP